MNKRIFSIRGIFLLLVIFVYISAKADMPQERKSISNTFPTSYGDWGNGFLSGNGKMGIIVFGNPLDETVIYNDRKFFMAASRERSFNTVSEDNLTKIRNYCANEKWKEANDLANAVHGWQDGGEGNKHPGYEMLIHIPKDGNVSNYSRECNFRTGEIIVRWADNRGNWERRSFVSRKDNVIVQYLTAPTAGLLNCTVQLGTDPGMNFPNTMTFTNVSDENYLNLRVKYPSNTNGAGYEGVTKIIISGGTKTMNNNVLTISDANSLLLLTRTDKYYSDCTTEWDKQPLQSQLNDISTDYNTLLQGQIETHQAIFDRVMLDFSANETDRALTNEALIAKQKSEPQAVTALWERLFYSGRYLYLSASSELSPPDLLGLWTGDCNVGWSGYYHLDANLNLQIGGGNIGDMPEAMEGYFSLMERLADGFRTNAQKLLGCRGMLGGGNTAGLNGLISALSYYYPYQYATGEMGWLLYPFWEHYLVTGDEAFLRDRLYPLLREMGDFYEDFLKVKDTNGKYIFAGSISPEDQPSGLGYSLVNNTTFDIAGAKFCLEKLIYICNKFGYEQGADQGVSRWTAILNQLPPYLINSDGALSEWSWHGLNDNYPHRHSSQMIPVWPLNEISKEQTPELYYAAQQTLIKKDGYSYEGAGHGILHAALNAANLNNDQSVNGKLLRFIKEDFFFKSLASAHYKDFNTFCTDVCNTVPTIMMEMLVNSKNQVIELLPALPQSLLTGSVSGIKTRNQVTVENLTWDMNERTISCQLKSNINQNITLIQRRGIVSITGNVPITASTIGNEARTIQLKAGETAEITLTVNEIPHNLALLRPVTASGTADNCPPENAVDGDTGTRWSSAYSDNQWITIDLGGMKNITEIRLNWEAAYGISYILQVSDDGKNWRNIYTQTNGKGSLEIIPVQGTGAYVKMQGVKRATSYGYSLWEIEVYGTDAVKENLALNRAAYHSSAIDYDHTAHLVTDGIKTVYDASVITSQYDDSPSGESKEMAFDGTVETKYLTFHPACWIQYAFSGGQAYAINKYSLASANDEPNRDPKNWTLQASNDGVNWTTLDTQSNMDFSDRKQTKTFTISNTAPYKIYRLNITANHGDTRTQFSELGLYEGDISRIDKPQFSSQWISKTGGAEWIYVDLGAVCDIENIKLFWNENFAKTYDIEFSEDAKTWQEIYSTTSGQGGTEEIPASGYARYVRLNLTEANNSQNYQLIEMEIYGYGGVKIVPQPQPPLQPDGTQYLSGGNWKLQRAEQVSGTGDEISQAAFDDSNWLIATVPGTVLTTYLNNGAIPDPNFGDQQLQISDAFFTADFWYRDSFTIPETYREKHIFLNFDGINWKADVYVNGHNAGRIEGAFIRGKFDITDYVTPGETAYLAVYIHKNDTPGAVTLQTLADAGPNGGALGADNPTIHASVGWDWLPTIRGRNIGIQDNVFLSSASAVSIENPFVTTKLNLPDTTSANLSLTVDLINNTNQAVNGTLSATLMPTGIAPVNVPVSLAAGETKTVTVDDIFVLSNPQLWWPNGYGEQFLYNFNLTFEENGNPSDVKIVPFGIREITTSTTDGILTVYVNGKRIYLRGGNWGLSEAQLRLDEEGYDVRVRLHKEENFTMIRNWVGQTGSDYFYKACDKYGILVWDDFWLANPGDGPNPNDETMFMANATDKIKRVRNHPSVALYCGRNEGNPPASLNTALKNAVETIDGTRIYIPHSADQLVSGYGPYSVQNPKWYFANRNSREIHSEIGMPNVPSVESMSAMMPEDKLWPINEMWGIHDYCNSAQGGNAFTAAVSKYGTPGSIEDFCLQAQMVNMENHKAMFESFAGCKSNGALMWMSQSAWPSTVWQTYDYYLEQTAGYYGCKKASEPLHILWDYNSNMVKVVNNTGHQFENLQAEATIYNMDGTLKDTKSFAIATLDDEVKNCFTITYPDDISPVHFIKLKLKRADEILSDNFYWRATNYQTYTPLRDMKKVGLEGALKDSVNGAKRFITTLITNPTSDVALMIRLKVLKSESGERVLPVFYSDNYFSLLPGESKSVILEFNTNDTNGENVKLMVEGWNIIPMEIAKEITGIQVIENGYSSDVVVYPNPTNHWLNVEGIHDFDVDIFNLFGLKIAHQTKQNYRINVQNLQAGTYIIQLKNSSKQVSKKIIKI